MQIISLDVNDMLEDRAQFWIVGSVYNLVKKDEVLEKAKTTLHSLGLHFDDFLVSCFMDHLIVCKRSSDGRL